MYRFREPVSGFTHLLGAALGFVGLIWLIALTADDTPKMISILVYGVAMIALYLASAAFHLYNGSRRTIARLNRLDHAAIYLFIAGSFTPFGYNLLDGRLRWGLLGLVWGLALTGAVMKLRRFWRGRRSTIQYMAMGWLSVVAIPPILHDGLIEVILWVAAGGLIYTIGAAVYALEKPNFHRHFGFHELWHLFVMGGSAVHFAAIVLFVI
jgi:hemolysin III